MIDGTSDIDSQRDRASKRREAGSPALRPARAPALREGGTWHISTGTALLGERRLSARSTRNDHGAKEINLRARIKC